MQKDANDYESKMKKADECVDILSRCAIEACASYYECRINVMELRHKEDTELIDSMTENSKCFEEYSQHIGYVLRSLTDVLKGIIESLNQDNIESSKDRIEAVEKSLLSIADKFINQAETKAPVDDPSPSYGGGPEESKGGCDNA